MIEPLKFTDPEVRRETYVAAFVATLNDKSDGRPSLDKSIALLIRYGFPKADVDLYVDEAHKKQWAMLDKVRKHA